MVSKLAFALAPTLALQVAVAAVAHGADVNGARPRVDAVGRAPVPPLIARADAALGTARAVAIDTIPPLQSSPRPAGMDYLHAVEVRRDGAWVVDERHTDASGRAIAETVTTADRTCRRVPSRPPSWQCDAGQHNPDLLRLPGGAATAWRPLGMRTLFGVASQGYDASFPDADGVTARVQYWIDPATARPVVAQATLAATGAGAAGTTAVVQAEHFSRWDDPALARLIPTVPAAPAVPGVPSAPPTARVTPTATVTPPVPLTVSVVPAVVRGALEVTSGRPATITATGARPRAYCGLTVLYGDRGHWGGSGFVGSTQSDGRGVASWAWAPRVSRAEIATAVVRCVTGELAEGQLSFTVVPPGWHW